MLDADCKVEQSSPRPHAEGYAINLTVYRGEIKLATVYGATVKECQLRADIVDDAFQRAERLG